MKVYIFFSVDEVDEVFKVELDQKVEDQDGTREARHLRRSLYETHMKMQ